MKTFKIVFLMVFILLFQACSINQDTIKSIAQSNSASEIAQYKNEVLKYLISYKKKLDIRNPNSYNKALSKNINLQISQNQNYIPVIQNHKKLENYNEYLHYAFSKEDIKNRNDFLIIGLYKMIYSVYRLEKSHQFVAMQYNKASMLKLYEYMQVIRWKIRTAKDLKGNYLFLTWQNNWQLELMKKDRSDLNIIKDLKYIKSNKETLFSPSNFSFEVLLSKMIVNIEYSLKKINVEPYEMSLSAIKSFVFII